MQRNPGRDPLEGFDYRELSGSLIQTRNDIRSRRPQPQIVVKLDLEENERAIVAGLLGNPNLEFKVVAVKEGDDANINLHIRLKQPKGGAA